MAWSDPGDFTSGQILTALQMDSIREAMFFGQGTFTNEAARDTAYNAAGAMSPITLQEGMRAYLTAPTVPAATGTSTQVPTGITTVYNGSAWICTTEIGASSNTSGTTTSTSYVTTLTGDATAISTTLVTGTTALVSLFGNTNNASAGFLNYVGVSVSGATTLAAGSGNEAYMNHNAGYWTPVARTFVLTGLTAGTNTFTLNYRVSGATGTYNPRGIVVKGIA
jgi:hypothetical protein